MSQKNRTSTNTATCADTICLSVLNPDSKPDPNQPVFYLGEAAVLKVRLVNATGNDIALKSGATLEIFFLALDVNLAACKIALPGWTLTSKQYSLSLAYTAGSPGTWGQGDANALAFQITGVQSSRSQATTGFFQVSFSGLTGNNIPGRLKMPLGLIAAPKDGNADLNLDVRLGDGGIIYVSQPDGSMVENRLLLNIVNMGAQELFSGTPGKEGTPMISVSFVYGSSPGALAPDDDKSAPQAGSAWNIKCIQSITDGNDWRPTDPDAAKLSDPVWVLKPDQNNHQLIGTGDSAAIQFEFDHVISKNAPDITLMYILFSGFRKNDTKDYNDKLFVLPITKEYLPNPGLLRFSSEVTNITINSSSQEVSIPLLWSMTGVSQIVLKCGSTVTPIIPDLIITYDGTQPALQQDQYTLKFQGVKFSGDLTITCSAYGTNGSFINDSQQTITFDFPPVVTLYTGDIQPDGSLLLTWTTEGAAKVTILSTDYDANGSTKIPMKSGEPLLDNPYYAITAHGVPGEDSGPYEFRFKKWAVIGDPISAGKTSHSGVAVSPNGHFAFVTNLGDNTVSVIDLRNGPPFNVLPQAIGVGKQPSNIAVSPNGHFAFVSNKYDFYVSVIDLRNGPPFNVLPQAIGVGEMPNDIVVSPKGDSAFVANYLSNSVSVIDLRNGPSFNVLPQEINLGSFAWSIVVSPNGHFAFVTGKDDNTVSVIDLHGPPFYAPQTIDVGNDPVSIAVSPNGGYVFVANSKDNTVSVIDLLSGQPFKVLPQAIGVGFAPISIAVSPNGGYVFVANQDGNTISVIGGVSVRAFPFIKN